jgi:transglutaminase superfamily protein
LPSQLLTIRTTARKLWRLSYREWLIVGETIALTFPIEVGLRRVPLDALVWRLARASRVNGDLPRRACDVERAARLVDAAAALYPLNATCLKKSLILVRILARRGIRAELRLGVRKVHEEFSAHAWVVCDGRIVLGGGIAHLFTPLPLTPGLPGATNVRRA